MRFSHSPLFNLATLLAIFSLSGLRTSSGAEEPIDVPVEIRQTLASLCSDCHGPELAEAGLNLDELPANLDDTVHRLKWIHIYDRVIQGQMPPDASASITQSLASELEPLRLALHSADLRDIQLHGRSPRRRLSQIEYEQLLRDLLHLPKLDVADLLPPDREALHFRRSTSVSDVSRVQIVAYLQAAESALQAAIADSIEPRAPQTFRFIGRQLFAETSTFGNREAMFFALDNQAIDDATLAMNATNEAVEAAIFRSAHWPYYGYPQGFVATESGSYRVRIQARAVTQVEGFQLQPAPQSITLTFRARKPSGPDVSGDVRETGGWIDVEPDLRWYETVIELKAGETFEYSVLGLPVPLARNVNGGEPTYRYPPFPAGGQRGLAVRTLELTGPLPPDSWPSQAHRSLLGELPFEMRTEPSVISPTSGLRIEAQSQDPTTDALLRVEQLLERVAVEELTAEERLPFQQLVKNELAQGSSFTDAMFVGFQAVLCSRHAIFAPEPLHADDHGAIALRLSLLLTNGPPDAELRMAARDKQLRDPRVLEQQIKRLMADERFSRFAQTFAEDWLDLKRLYRGEIDERLYPEYRFDAYLVASMERETIFFVEQLFRQNEPATAIIDTDEVNVNDRLAQHYGLEPIAGSGLQRIALADDSPYGGLLTQGAILKLTANGVSTSPIVRGAWVMDRLLGSPPPPPPASVPAVEPDIRGATTIRELLARHAADRSCAHCHAKFDPVGLALENFDVLGGWRDRYRSLGEGERVTGIDRAGHDFAYSLAAEIDPSGMLNDGRTFDEVRTLKRLLTENQRQLARNLVHQLTIHATGTPVRFADRVEVEAILDRCAEQGYRAGDLLRALICSPIFLGPAGLEGSKSESVNEPRSQMQ